MHSDLTMARMIMSFAEPSEAPFYGNFMALFQQKVVVLLILLRQSEIDFLPTYHTQFQHNPGIVIIMCVMHAQQN